MRMLPRILSLLAVVSSSLFFMNCGGGGGEETPAEKTQLAQLSKTWTVNTVTLDGVDRKSDFTNFKLTLGGTFNESDPKGPYTYSVSGSRPTPNPWPASGTWKFGSDPTHDILRLDPTSNLAINYTVTGSTLSLTFTYSGEGFDGGRTEEVSGEWKFTFN